MVSADDDRLVAWRGRLAAIAAPGALAEVVVEVFERLDGTSGGGAAIASRTATTRSPRSMSSSPRPACGSWQRGQRTGAILDAGVDEDVHTKAIFLAARA